MSERKDRRNLEEGMRPGEKAWRPAAASKKPVAPPPKPADASSAKPPKKN